MTSCNHQNLVLLPRQNDRLRCRHCHLTIHVAELGNGYCPECYETSGRRRYDFEAVQRPDVERTQYRCETCGVLITCD